jgi:hypothetical protein
MLLDPQVGLVVQQAVEHVGRVAHADIDHLGVEWRVLVGDVGVKVRPGLLPYFGLMCPVLSACSRFGSSGRPTMMWCRRPNARRRDAGTGR